MDIIVNTYKKAKMKFLDFINYHLQGFGFSGANDLMVSTLHTDKNWGVIVALSAFFGGVAMSVETYLGLQLTAYAGFLALLILEFITGIKASLKSGKKIESRKLGRMIVKIGFYTIILGIAQSLKGGGDLAHTIWDWVHFTVFNMVAVQLIISVFENLSKLGYTETNKILRAINKKLSKWFDFEEPADRD